MDVLTWVFALLLAGLAICQWLVIGKLRKQAADNLSALGDLTFKFDETAKFVENQIARVRFDYLKRIDRLVFKDDAKIAEALAHPGAREILVEKKLIKRSDAGPFQETLAEKARQNDVPLDPVLIALNDLESRP